MIKKEIAEQITSKLNLNGIDELLAKKGDSNTKNDRKQTNFDLLEGIKAESSKLRANKNIFARGDFDNYKISDEELEEHCKDVEKSRIGKYISKTPVVRNGKLSWEYKYHLDRKNAASKVQECTSPLLKCDVNNASQQGKKFLNNWRDDWEKHPEKSRNSVLGKHISLLINTKSGDEGITSIHLDHKGSNKNEPRTPEETFMRAKLLPIAKEMLENKDKATVYEVRNNGNYVEYSLIGKYVDSGKEKKVCVIISKNKEEGDVYLSVMRKAISLNNDIAFITDVFLKSSKDVHFSAGQRAYSERPFPNRIPSLSQNNNKSTIQPDYNGKNMLHKSFEVVVTDITLNNKQKKIEQIQKALKAVHAQKPFIINHVSADNSRKLKNITLKISNFDNDKINKAIRKLSFSLDTPLQAASGEVFLFRTQEELTNKLVTELTEDTKSLYSWLISYFGLPEIRIVAKADLTYKGKTLYSPETGKPISTSEWKSFVKKLEKMLSKKAGFGQKIVLSSVALGKILSRMLKTNTLEAIKNKSLDELKIENHKLDYIANNFKTMTNTFGNSFTREQQSKLQIASQSAAQRITKVNDATRNSIQQIIIDSIKNKESKSVVSQKLFDSCMGMNRDFQRIADTEIQNNMNESYIQEEVYNSRPDEKVYFKRFEMLDDNTCPRCKALRGMVVLYSDNPLPSSKIKDEYADYAIWEGSGINNKDDIPIGIAHPWCRGSWYRYYPEVEEM